MLPPCVGVFPLPLAPSSYCCVTKPAPNLVVKIDNHFIMLTASLHQEFREGIVDMVCLCMMISETWENRDSWPAECQNHLEASLIIWLQGWWPESWAQPGLLSGVPASTLSFPSLLGLPFGIVVLGESDFRCHIRPSKQVFRWARWKPQHGLSDVVTPRSPYWLVESSWLRGEQIQPLPLSGRSVKKLRVVF